MYLLLSRRVSFIPLSVQWCRKNNTLIVVSRLRYSSKRDCPLQWRGYYKKGLNYHRKHNISLVFQNYNLIDYLTTVENVKLGGSGNAEKLLEEVGIGKEYWQRNVLQLSGGQQQRVAIARALASDAHVLLADEPTGNLDETTADEIIALLKKTAHELGKCVVVVTHSKHLAEEADEILEIKNGAISFLSE